MKYALRKTPSHLHLAYKYGEPGGGVLARNLVLTIEGRELKLDVDLEGNLKARNKSAHWYVGAVFLGRNPHKLKSVQCPDNLVRARLIRAWEQVVQPQLLLRLDLGEMGAFLYEVAPHSLFMGGIQLDVQHYRGEAGRPEGARRTETEDDSEHA